MTPSEHSRYVRVLWWMHNAWFQKGFKINKPLTLKVGHFKDKTTELPKHINDANDVRSWQYKSNFLLKITLALQLPWAWSILVFCIRVCLYYPVIVAGSRAKVILFYFSLSTLTQDLQVLSLYRPCLRLC